MKENKVEQVKFNKEHEEFQIQINTIKYAVQDTFRTLLATDNYI